MYQNERGVGEGIRASDVSRSDIWITSKLNNGAHEPDQARRAFDRTLEQLGFDSVDLFLIHWPLPTLYDGDFVSTWKALEEFKADGRAKSIGVSNFLPEHLERVIDTCEVVPAVNQIEVHPYFTNRELREFAASREVAIEAYSPIAQGEVLDDPVLTGIAGEVGKSVAQVVLRWHIQIDAIIFPKSTKGDRMRENFEIFDFELSPGQMEQIDALDKGEDGRTGANPATFDLLPS
jgi:2,5-diketo-D-gluconate reductase A